MRSAGSGGHPSLDIVDSHGTELSGKKIVLCVAGSVAAYKAIELARLLMRHGADVRCVLSGAASRLVRAEYFRWATGNEVVTKLTGKLEHISLADYGKSDLVIVYPATANTLGKLANGIDDTPVSTVLTVAFGSGIPILMCLAMHASMYGNAAVRRNMGFLGGKMEFLSPRLIEGKAKAPEPEDVLEKIMGRLGGSSVLRGKRVLMTAGPTVEFIDPIRVVTNLSTGRTGVLLARRLMDAGAKVTLVYGPGSEDAPAGARHIPIQTGGEMARAVTKEMRKKIDIVIMAAAVSDYTIRGAGRKKIPSGKDLTIRLERTPKIIDGIKKMQGSVFLVGFKAETNVGRKGLEAAARRKMRESGADIIVANDVGSARYLKNPGSNEVVVVGSRTKWSGWKKKEDIAQFIMGEIEREIGKK